MISNFFKLNLPIILLIAITGTTFIPSLHHSYVSWDDPLSLDYVLIRSIQWEGLQKIFTSVINTTYNPLTILSFALEYHFFKYNFLIFHLNNILLHIAVAVLCYFFGLKLGLKKWTAFAGVLLFAIHPMRVESVSWITERKDVLYAFLYMLSLHAYLKYLKNDQKKFYILSFFLGFLSMLAKPMALSLPLILLLLDWYFKRVNIRKCLLEKIPYFLYILPLAYISHAHSYHAVSINDNPLTALLIFIWTFSFYLIKFFYPVNLVPMYATPEPITLANPTYILSLFVLITIFSTMYRFRHDRWYIFCFMFYLASMFLLFRFDKMENLNVVADRFMYLPSLGLCFLIVSKIEEGAFGKTIRFKIIGGLILGVLMISLISKNVTQQKIWMSSMNLWSQVVQYQPTIAIAHNNLGFSFIESNQWGLAEKSFKKAIEIFPHYATAYGNLGSLYYLQNKLDQAELYLKKALDLEPTHSKSHNLLGLVNEKHEHFDEALFHFTKALEFDPNNEEYFLNRARIHKKKGLFNKALEDLKTLSKIFPEFISSYMGQGDIYSQLNDFPSAIANYLKVIQINPTSHDAYNNLGVLYAAQGQIDIAIQAMNSALKINPKSVMALINRSKIYKKSGNLSAALADALLAKSFGAPDIDPYLKEIKNEMSLKK